MGKNNGLQNDKYVDYRNICKITGHQTDCAVFQPHSPGILVPLVFLLQFGGGVLWSR